MNSKSNNYMVIMIVLLLVVAIITGAGLCYLSWSDDVKESNVSTEQATEVSSEVATEQTTEVNSEVQESTEVTEPAKEGIQANTVTMEQIKVLDSGEYQYIKDGEVASKRGIDVSKYQKDIDWKAVADLGMDYAFIRVGCRGYGSSGTLIKDERFHENIKDALAQGIDVGAYFFSQAITVEEAKAEAEFVIKELEGYTITYPVAIDIERVDNAKARQDVLTVEKRTEICKVFCEAIKEAGYIPMVYGDSETFAELINPEEVYEYDFWICETDGNMTFPYEFAIWQYSHKGIVAGIEGETSISISLKEW